MNKYLLLNEALTFNGAIVEAGEVIELPEKSAQALIEEGKAKEVIPDEETGKALGGVGSPGNDETTDPHLTPSNNPENEPGEELELIKKALSDKYEDVEALREVAKEVDIAVAWNAGKDTVINKIIEAGKAEAVLAK